MHNEFTAVIERDGQWFVAYSPEIPEPTDKARPKPKHWGTAWLKRLN
jgi:hypothetical protein